MLPLWQECGNKSINVLKVLLYIGLPRDLKSLARKGVPVRFRLWAPIKEHKTYINRLGVKPVLCFRHIIDTKGDILG